MSPRVRENLDDVIKLVIALIGIWAMLNRIPTKDDLRTALDARMVPVIAKVDSISFRLDSHLEMERLREHMRASKSRDESYRRRD